MSTVVVNANPLSSGTPVAATLSTITGMDQGTVAAKLDAEIRDEENRRMMNPSAFPELDSPYEVAKTSMKNVRAELLNPEMDLSKEPSATTTEQAPGASEFSAQTMDDLDAIADVANSINPDPYDDISGADIAMNQQSDPSSVNGDSDLTNQSLDFINSIEPTPDQPAPEVDLVQGEETTGDNQETEDNQIEDDPNMALGGEI